MTDPLLDALRRAVAASPADIALRVHLAELLEAAGERDEAVSVIAAVVATEPENVGARSVMLRLLSPPSSRPSAPSADPDPVPETPIEESPFDWGSAEDQVADLQQPAFVETDDTSEPESPLVLTERPSVTLDDVGGMATVKERLRASFLEPPKNPELRRLYGKSLRGGLLLYGPPGCGKTYIAKALAGELGASFLSVGLSDILDAYIGNSEKNVHEAFQLARRQSPCVLFIDEIDALGSDGARLAIRPFAAP